MGMALALAGVAALTLGAQQAVAQDFPTKPIHLIVPFGAGGGTDIIARIVGDELSKSIGQSIIVETRPGANGAIGSAVVKDAAPDGYTLLVTASSTYSLNPNLFKELPYDQLNDFVGVAPLSRTPWMLTVPADSPFQTVTDVVEAAKEKPGTLTAGYWTTSVFVTTSVFEEAAGIELRKVPYQGAVEAHTDAIAGRINMLVTDRSTGGSHVDAGKLRVLATTTAERSQILKDVPTMKEAGYPVITDTVLAVFAPAKTPAAILDKLNAEFTEVISNSQTVRERMIGIGMEPTTMSRGDFDDFVASELTRWGDMIASAGIEKQ
jgi:tripartite-type tricarboxylate transporter receptor subunit TctC